MGGLSGRIRRLARRLSGTDAVVRNLASHLRAERELIQAQADRLQGELRLALDSLAGDLRATDNTHDPEEIVGPVLKEMAILREELGLVDAGLAELSCQVSGLAADRERQDPGQQGLPTLEPVCLAALKELEPRGVFIVGSARSGTTILLRCLNQSPDVLLFGESNSYRHQPGEDFRVLFNRRQIREGTHPAKGSWIPDLPVASPSPLDYYIALLGSYARVGEKVAFGPERGIGPLLGMFMDWQSRHFLHSAYLCTIREPRACVWSMCKMFPGIDRRHICRTWLLVAATILDLYRTFPNVLVIFNENFDEPAVARIALVLGVRFELAPGTITQSHVHTRLEGGVLPDALEPVARELDELGAIYDELRGGFDPETFAEDRSRFMVPVFGALRRRIDALLDEFDLRDAQTTAGPLGPASVPSVG